MMTTAKPWPLPWYMAAQSPSYSLQYRHYVITCVLDVISVLDCFLQGAILLPVMELAILRFAQNATALVNSTLEALPQVSRNSQRVERAPFAICDLTHLLFVPVTNDTKSNRPISLLVNEEALGRPPRVTREQTQYIRMFDLNTIFAAKEPYPSAKEPHLTSVWFSQLFLLNPKQTKNCLSSSSSPSPSSSSCRWLMRSCQGPLAE